MKKIENSVQDWLPLEKILEKGIIKIKENKYIKIIKVIPINFNLKSDLEKEAILNSYKIFFKTCNFDIQILIQSNREDLSSHISKIKNQIKKQDNCIISISEKYISYIKNLNQEKKSVSKNFYILIKNSQINQEESIIEELSEKYFKIKECLARCGNLVIELSNREELMNVLFSFFNTRKILNK